MKRLLLLIPSTTYRAADFMAAASQLDVELIVGSERRQALEGLTGGTATFNFRDVNAGMRQIVKHVKTNPIDAIVAVDDEAVVLAARAAEALSLPHNRPSAVAATRVEVFQTRCFGENERAELKYGAGWCEGRVRATDGVDIVISRSLKRGAAGRTRVFVW